MCALWFGVNSPQSDQCLQRRARHRAQKIPELALRTHQTRELRATARLCQQHLLPALSACPRYLAREGWWSKSTLARGSQRRRSTHRASKRGETGEEASKLIIVTGTKAAAGDMASTNAMAQHRRTMDASRPQVFRRLCWQTSPPQANRRGHVTLKASACRWPYNSVPQSRWLSCGAHAPLGHWGGAWPHASGDMCATDSCDTAA